MLPIIFLVPIVPLIILMSTATFEMKNIRISVVDNDLTSISRGLSSKFQGSLIYQISQTSFSYQKAENQMQQGIGKLLFNILIEGSLWLVFRLYLFIFSYFCHSGCWCLH